MVNAVTVEGVRLSTGIQGNLDQFKFYALLQDVILPSVPKETAFIVDNLGVHRARAIRCLIESAGCSLIFLPPYSPEFNPTEECNSKVKHILQEAGARTFGALIEAFRRALGQVTERDIVGWIRHAILTWWGCST